MFAHGAAEVSSAGCSLRKVNEFRVDLRLGTRRIAIVGWEHLAPDTEEWKAVNRSLRTSAAWALKGDCEAAAGVLRGLLMRSYPKLVAGLKSKAALAEVESTFHPLWMGTEFGPGEWLERMRVMRSQNDFFDHMEKTCEAETHNAVAALRLIYPGPDFNYLSAAAAPIESFGIEDPELKARAMEIAESIPRLPEPRLGTSAANYIKQFLIAAREGRTDEAIAKLDLALEAQEFGVERDKLKDMREAYYKLFALSPLRNLAMAKRLMNTTGDGVVPIGSSHVRDLADKTMELCKAQTAQRHPVADRLNSAPYASQ